MHCSQLEHKVQEQANRLSAADSQIADFRQVRSHSSGSRTRTSHACLASGGISPIHGTTYSTQPNPSLPAPHRPPTRPRTLRKELRDRQRQVEAYQKTYNNLRSSSHGGSASPHHSIVPVGSGNGGGGGGGGGGMAMTMTTPTRSRSQSNTSNTSSLHGSRSAHNSERSRSGNFSNSNGNGRINSWRTGSSGGPGSTPRGRGSGGGGGGGPLTPGGGTFGDPGYGAHKRRPSPARSDRSDSSKAHQRTPSYSRGSSRIRTPGGSWGQPTAGKGVRQHAPSFMGEYPKNTPTQ